jgi:hypothetical protein
VSPTTLRTRHRGGRSRRSIAGHIFDGADPAGEKQTEHQQDDNTVQALYELYRSRKEKVLRSWSEVRRIPEKSFIGIQEIRNGFSTDELKHTYGLRSQ